MNGIPNIWAWIIGIFLVLHIISSPAFWIAIVTFIISATGMMWFPLALGLIAIFIHLISSLCDKIESSTKDIKAVIFLKRSFNRFKSFVESDKVDNFLDNALLYFLGISVFCFSIFMLSVFFA